MSENFERTPSESVESYDPVNEPLPAELVNDVEKVIDSSHAGDKDADPELVDLTQRPGIYERTKELIGDLRGGRTMADVVDEVTDDALTGAKRETLVGAVEGVTGAVRYTLLGSSGEERLSSLDEKQASLLEMTEEINSQLGLNEEDLRAHKTGDRRGNPRSPDTVILGQEETAEKAKIRARRWDVQVDKFNGDSGHDAVVEARKEYLERMFTRSDPPEKPISEAFQQEQQKLVQNARRNLRIAKEVSREGTPLGMMMRAESNHVRQRANIFLRRLESGESTLGDLVNQSDDISLRAGRLISTMFVESGYGEDGQQKSRDAMSEQEKRMVDTGQLLGMECERILLEGKFHDGIITPKQAERAYKKYRLLSEHDGIPEEFKRSAQETMEKFDQRYGFTEARATRRQEKASAEAARQMNVQVEAARQIKESRENPLDNMIRAEFRSAGEMSRDQMEGFLQNFSEQLKYARFVSEKPKGILGKITRPFRSFAGRMIAHAQVYGAVRSLKALVPVWGTRSADREIMQARGHMNFALGNAEQNNDVPDGTLTQYIDMFAKANVAQQRAVEKRGRLGRWFRGLFGRGAESALEESSGVVPESNTEIEELLDVEPLEVSPNDPLQSFTASTEDEKNSELPEAAAGHASSNVIFEDRSVLVDEENDSESTIDDPLQPFVASTEDVPDHAEDEDDDSAASVLSDDEEVTDKNPTADLSSGDTGVIEGRSKSEQLSADEFFEKVSETHPHLLEQYVLLVKGLTGDEENREHLKDVMKKRFDLNGLDLPDEDALRSWLRKGGDKTGLVSAK